MRKVTFILIALLICTVFLTSCKQKDETGKPTETTSLKIGHVGHDHHSALFVALDNASEFANGNLHKNKPGKNFKGVVIIKVTEVYDASRGENAGKLIAKE